MRLTTYYTQIDSGEAFERFSRTGPFADIVIRLDEGGVEVGRFVFHRKTSYLPYWEVAGREFPVEELVPRQGDGDARRPDRVNAHSHVRIIEQTDALACIHWRYVPTFSGTNPHHGLTPHNFVDEYFTLHADGSVERSVRVGNGSIQDWQRGAQLTVQRFFLTTRGIERVETSQASPDVSVDKAAGSPIRRLSGPAPVLEFSLDEGAGPATKEAVTGVAVPVLGAKPYWKAGVSGTALMFDGYTSQIVLPVEKTPAIAQAITLEAWVALGAYPWNWAPIVQQGDDSGYFLGIDGHGRPGLRLDLGGTYSECVGVETLERDRWYHIAGRYSAEMRMMEVFVNGARMACLETSGQPVRTVEEPVKIGKGKPRMPSDPVRASTYPSEYSFDGMIDEVRVYDVVLTDEVIREHSMPPGNLPALQPRSLPVFADTAFRARQTRLPFYETWDNLGRVSEHCDIVVGFDKHPTNFVFWRAMSYIPMLSNEKGQWYSNEFNETWNTSGGAGCQEPMSDKQNHFSHVRLIEDTPARKVVQWRFALENVKKVIANFVPETGWGDYSDWYYYIYPDGIAVKTMHLWTHGLINHEWQESMAIFGPNQHPEDIVDKDRALTLLDLQGAKAEYRWTDGPPKTIDDPVDKCIQYIRYKGTYHPLTIAPDVARYDVYGGELTDYSVFPTWNHWPVAQILSDGRYASFPDRTAHSSLTHFIPAPHRGEEGPAPWQERVMMEGMTNLTPEETVPLARSWLRPPRLVWPSCTYLGYERGQRAYVLRKFADRKVKFQIHASEQSPIHNLCFEVKGWPSRDLADVVIDGQTLPRDDRNRQGIKIDTDGTPTLLVWLEMKATGRFVFEINPCTP